LKDLKFLMKKWRFSAKKVLQSGNVCGII